MNFMSAKFYQRTIKIATGEQITAKFYIASSMDFVLNQRQIVMQLIGQKAELLEQMPLFSQYKLTKKDI